MFVCVLNSGKSLCVGVDRICVCFDQWEEFVRVLTNGVCSCVLWSVGSVCAACFKQWEEFACVLTSSSGTA